MLRPVHFTHIPSIRHVLICNHSCSPVWGFWEVSKWTFSCIFQLRTRHFETPSETINCQYFAGFTRKNVNSGAFSRCLKCWCNGRSSQCDPESGVCIGCDIGSTGDYCENCEFNVVGPYCNICADGFYGLTQDHKNCKRKCELHRYLKPGVTLHYAHVSECKQTWTLFWTMKMF